MHTAISHRPSAAAAALASSSSFSKNNAITTTHPNSSSSDLISNNNVSINTVATSVTSSTPPTTTTDTTATSTAQPGIELSANGQQRTNNNSNVLSYSASSATGVGNASNVTSNHSGNHSGSTPFVSCSEFPQSISGSIDNKGSSISSSHNNAHKISSVSITNQPSSELALNSNYNITNINNNNNASNTPPTSNSLPKPLLHPIQTSHLKSCSSSEPFPAQGRAILSHPQNNTAVNSDSNTLTTTVTVPNNTLTLNYPNNDNTKVRVPSDDFVSPVTPITPGENASTAFAGPATSTPRRAEVEGTANNTASYTVTSSPGRIEYIRRKTYPQESSKLNSFKSNNSLLRPNNLKREDTLNDSANQEIQRMKFMILNKRETKKNKKHFLDDDKVLIGNKVSEGHSNYIMAYNMLTGIRVAVSRCSGIMKPLKEQDFKASKKLTFDITGNELTPSSKYDFKFKDYSPNVFRELRDLFGLDPADYLVSLTAKYILSELNSPGKSGSFFYYSRDYKFIIKTIHRSEHVTLRRILKNYHEHVKNNPNTLVSQFYGLHRLKMPLSFSGRKRKIYFIVMNNLFPANKEIHRTYDLKGSLWKRKTKVDSSCEGELEEDNDGQYGKSQKEKNGSNGSSSNNDNSNSNNNEKHLYPKNKHKLLEDKQRDPKTKKQRPILKDQNWINNNEKILLGPTARHNLVGQLERDVAFLQKSNIMDYSLLLGIHDIKIGNVNSKNFSVFAPKDATNRNEINLTNPVTVDNLNATRIDSDGDEVALQTYETPSFNDRFYFYNYENGFRSTDANDVPTNEIYYLGVIDCLTNYNYVKKAETFVKSFYQTRKEISAVPAVEYGDRFLGFIKKSLN